METAHEEYLKILLDSGLFSIDERLGIDLLRLNETNYYLATKVYLGDDCFYTYWLTNKKTEESFIFVIVQFEEIFDLVPIHIKEKMIWYLDILRA